LEVRVASEQRVLFQRGSLARRAGLGEVDRRAV
jgi:hypothetical protein